MKLNNLVKGLACPYSVKIGSGCGQRLEKVETAQYEELYRFSGVLASILVVCVSRRNPPLQFEVNQIRSLLC